MNVSMDTNTSECNTTENGKQQTGTNYRIFYAALFLLCFCVLLGNGIIVHVYRTVKKARTPRNFFIFMLAMTDLSFVPIIPLMALTYFIRVKVGDNQFLQILNYAVYITSLSASTLSLFMMSFDRFLAIIYPLKHRKVALGERPVTMIASVWISAIVIGFVIPMAWHQPYDPSACDTDWDLLQVIRLEYFKYILFPIFISISALMLVFYIAIFVEVRRQRSWRENFDQAIRKNVIKKETKMVVTAILLIGLFYASWLPFILLTGAQVWNQTLRANPSLTFVRVILGILPMVNSAVNPAIYAFRVPVFNRYVRSMLHCCFKTKVDLETTNLSTSTYDDKLECKVISHNKIGPKISKTSG